MSRFKHMMFVCTRTRDADDKKGSCGRRGSEDLLDRLKELTKEHKMKGKVRVTSSGCLDYCEKGCAVAVFSSPEGRSAPTETWYTHLKAKDADRLFEEHVLKNGRFEEHVEK